MSMLLQAETAQALLREDPAESASLLAGLIDQLSTATTDIRRLVYNLRPPALDDLGLAGAIRAQAQEFNSSSLNIQLALSDNVPPLPAAVEVAAFRIVQEALTNVVRHAHARHCTVQLEVNDALEVEIADDGQGLTPQSRSGVGLASMRERAAELGGTCTVDAGAAGGVRVRARLPLVITSAPVEDGEA